MERDVVVAPFFSRRKILGSSEPELEFSKTPKAKNRKVDISGFLLAVILI